jgi:hypothetical protein
MEEWIIRGAIAIVAAGVGCAVTAVLRPRVEDDLRRRTTNKDRQREVVQERLERGRRELRFVESVGALLAADYPPEEALQETIHIVGPVFEANQSSNFRAESIDDLLLRNLINEFDTGVNHLLWQAFRSTRERGSLDRSDFLERYPYQTLELRDLEGQVIDRIEKVLGIREVVAVR